MSVVGVDLGGTNIAALVVADDGGRSTPVKMRTPTTGDRQQVVDVLEAAVRGAVENAGIGLDDLAAAGVGTPGVVIDGTVGGAANVPGWSERFALGEMLTARLGCPVRVVNDVTAAAVGESREGAGRGFEDLLVVFVGTGVGSGLIIHGEPFEGAHGGAGEFGHMVVNIDGEICPCGRRGCIEAYASRRAMEQAAERAVAQGRETVLFDLMRRKDRARPTSGVFREALEAGDRLTVDLLETGIAALGAGLASAVNLLDVEAVVVGGGLADKLGDWYHIRLEAAMRPHLFLQPPIVRILPAELADTAGALGAALLAQRQI
jgi:glucokinase